MVRANDLIRVLKTMAPLATLLICGCQTTAEQQADPLAWGRIDCQRADNTPALLQPFEQAKLVCVNRAEAAGIAGTAAMPTGYGLTGALVSGMNKGITASQIQDATIKSCMAEYGYSLLRKSEFDARCPIVQAAAPPPPTPKKTRKTPPQSSKGISTVPVVTIPPAPVSAQAAPVQPEPQMSDRDRTMNSRN